MAKLNVYLNFNGTCRDAMNFYQSVFGGEVHFMNLGDSPMGKDAPEEQKNQVLHSWLKTSELEIFAADSMGMEMHSGNNIRLCISGTDKDKVTEYYNKLAEGGKVGHELKEEFFGMYGDLTDKFGVTWMFQSSEEQM